MNILLVNKFLYPKGGAETYVFKLGEIFESNGHNVQYFGLESSENIVFNNVGSYAKPQEFSNGIRSNLLAPFRIIYSIENRNKIQKVLKDFKPDIVHLNNIQFHLTPSIILEIDKWRKENNPKCKIVYTAHDFQLICPSHGLFDNNLNPCEKCLAGNYTYCFKTKCVKNSRLKSLMGMADAYFWKNNKAYSYIDKIICPSQFLKNKLDIQERFRNKTVALHNFVEKIDAFETEKEDYVLDFGKMCKEKGTYTLLETCKKMPNIRFVFAGYGEAVEEIKNVPNAQYVGFKNGEELAQLISKAMVSVSPSECYENCPFSVVESQMYLTPVVASRIGGIPELITEGKTGELFEAGNADDLAQKLRKVINNSKIYSENCKNINLETADTYYNKLIKIYEGSTYENI